MTAPQPAPPPAPPSAPRLASWLLDEGRPRTVGGNEALRLDADAETAWLVEEGQVEIFAHAAAGGEIGRRTHVTTVGSGGLIFSVGHPPSPGVPRPGRGEAPAATLVAVALPDTRLRELATPRLRQLAREPAHLAAMAGAVDAWLAGLLAGVAPSTAPQHFVELEPGSEVRLDEEGKVARPVSGIVWVRHVAGASRFLGRRELTLEPAGYLLPISATTWLTSSAADTTLSCVETALLLRSGGVWEGLARFHELFLAVLAQEAAAAAREERARLRRKLDFDRRALQSAYSRLAAVLRPSAAAGLAVDDAAEPLFEACRLVAEAQGIALRRPPESPAAGNPAYRLSRICAVSRVRHRRVILRDDWWQRDNGPLVGFLMEEETRRPVALLPTSSRSYTLVDPVAQRRAPLDAALAEQLAGVAHMLYPPLPERPLGRLDLVRAALRGRGRDLSGIALMGVGGGLLGMLVPIVTGYLFGNVIPDADRPRLVQMSLALVVSALAAAAFQITRSIAVLRLSGKMDGSLQAAVWDRLLALPASFFRGFTVGDLANRSMGIDAIRNLVVGRASTSILAATFSLFSFALLFYYSPPLALLATGLVAVMMAVAAVLAYLQLRHQRQLLQLQGKLASLVFGLIHGVAKLRVAGAEPHAFALWAERFSEQRQRALQAQRIANLQTSLNAFYPIVTALGIFAMVNVTVETGLPVSDFLAFNAAFGQFQAAALTVVALFSDVLMVVPIYERVRPLLETAPEVDATKAEAGELTGDVEFSHVSFRYQDDGPLILDDVSFRARPGELIALVGPSGSGKSTCLRLLLGFEQPRSGSIYFDGQDLPSLDLASVRRQIGVVLQDGRPMAGDIFTNIVGNADLKLEDAWEAARLAGLADDVKKMPMGMHTVISEGAGTFSGGQIQRLLIARAIVARPRILLFDEATSALDNRTQGIVGHSLERLKATRIIIAHRLSTIRHADRIYVLDGGRRVEEGTYDELAARGGVFGRLVERQVA